MPPYYLQHGNEINIEDLHSYGVLVNRDQYIPFIDAHPLGAVTLVFPDHSKAEPWLERLRARYPKIECRPLGDPWRAMRKAAGEAIGGFQVHSGGFGVPDLFLFMCRIEEAGVDLPTVLTHIVPPGEAKASLTRTGQRSFTHEELLHWSRHDVLDRNPILRQTTTPFRDWRQGDPLYEIQAPHALCTIASVPLLGSWTAARGAIPFFTDEEQAWECISTCGTSGELSFIGEKGRRDYTRHKGVSPELMQVVPIYNLKVRLEQIRTGYDLYRGLIDICINPQHIRARMAWGSLLWGDEFGEARHVKDSRFASLLAQHPGPWLRTLAGLWSVEEGNRFKCVDPVNWWTGFDTVFWSGGQDQRLVPLGRSLVADRTRDCLGLDGDASEIEIRETIEDYLAQDTENGPERGSVTCPLHEYLFIGRATVENLYYDEICLQFETAIDCIHSLIQYERTMDRPKRSTGTIAKSGCGFIGSNNPEAEERKGEALRLGLTRIATRIISRGYLPSDSNAIVALCNTVLRTMHIELAGFAHDLLEASDEDQRDWLLKVLGRSPDFWDQWSDGPMMPVDPHGLAVVQRHFGDDAYLRLTMKSLHFLATALASFEERGYAPGLDYAPISVEIVKALETELGEIFQAFRETVKDDLPHIDDRDKNQVRLNRFLCGKQTLTIGNYKHLLKGKFRPETQLTQRLNAFIRALPNADYLSGQEFLDQVLSDVLTKYRNGGAHSEPIPYKTCLECVQTLVGTPEQPGVISHVVGWKPLPLPGGR